MHLSIYIKLHFNSCLSTSLCPSSSHLHISPFLHLHTSPHQLKRDCTQDRAWISNGTSLCLAVTEGTDRMKTGKPNDSYLHIPAHGGDFDPTSYNRPRGQPNDARPSGTWAPGPAHGGDFDPNEFHPTRFPEHSQSQQPSSLRNASSAAQGVSNGRNMSNRSNQVHSSSPASELHDVGSPFFCLASITSFLT